MCAIEVAVASPSGDALRWPPLQGCRNFRDLGGYRAVDGRVVRWRCLFRSANLAGMTAEDARAFDETLGIRTVIDLRHPREREAEAPPLHHARVLHHSLNLPASDVPRVRDVAALYLWMARGLGAVVADVIAAINADGALPLLFHCAAGKDRTGIVVAIVLSLLGVEDADIVADYVLTESVRDLLSERELTAAFDYVRCHELPDELLHASTPAMVGFLAGLRAEYGSVENYVARHGVNAEHLARLRTRLLVKHGKQADACFGADERVRAET